MERLTKYNNGRYEIEPGVRMLYEALTKLGKYEDMGVSPEQFHEFSNIYLEKCEEVNRLKRELTEYKSFGNSEQVNGRWIPVEEKYPDSNDYILLSFSNFSIPVVGRWEEDEDGGAFYAGDDTETCVSQDMFVNAWMPLVKPYREEE